MRAIATLVPAILATLFLTFSVGAHEVRSGDIVITHPVIPAPVAGQPVAAGYLEITNSGDRTERLVSVEAEFSGKAEVHRMELVNGVMRMRPAGDGLDIPAGETVILKRGGLHLMFMRLSQTPEIGQFRKVILNFARAGAIEVEMLVVDPANLDDEQQEPAKEHSGHQHSGHSGSSE